jgi:hypothetical protein
MFQRQNGFDCTTSGAAVAFELAKFKLVVVKFNRMCRWPEEKPLEDHSLLPGPQDYNVSSPDAGPAYTIGAKLHHAEGNDTPGPGAHSVAASREGPAYTILGRHEDVQAEQSASPGPAAYDAKVSCTASNSQSLHVHILLCEHIPP